VAIVKLVVMLSPMVPHLAELCWTRLCHDNMVAQALWPTYVKTLTVDDTVTLPVQINGKRRGEIEAPKNADSEMVESMTLSAPFVVQHLDGKTPKKVIVVPNRIVNLVV
ncbi:MAG: class I tRNA ligase family protein, partial [Pseudomonadota bacterium]